MERPAIPVKIGSIVTSLLQNDEKIKIYFKVNFGTQRTSGMYYKLKGMCYITNLKLIFFIQKVPIYIGPLPWFIILPRNAITNIEIKKDWHKREWVHIKWRTFSTFEKFKFTFLEKDKNKCKSLVEKIVNILLNNT